MASSASAMASRSVSPCHSSSRETIAPFGPYGVEDRAYERRLGTLGDGEPERA